MVDGQPQARLHSCEGRSTSLDLVQICRIWFAGTSRRSLAMETQSSLANDVRDVEPAGTMQDFIVRYEVVPSDVQDASLAPYME